MRRPTPRPGQGLSAQRTDTSKTAAGSTVKRWEAGTETEAAGNVLAVNQAADEVAKFLDAGDLTVTRVHRGRTAVRRADQVYQGADLRRSCQVQVRTLGGIWNLLQQPL